jgi:hypothetical protein
MSRSEKFRIRVVSRWPRCLETETAVLASEIPAEQADALLCEWEPSEELLTFPRRKAWYCCEPACQFNHLRGGAWPRLRDQLGPHEFLYHAHPDPQFRVPHATHFEPLQVNTNRVRRDRAIAVVSNHGGAPWRRHGGLSYRNRFITDRRVDLYGRSGWLRYRDRWFSRVKAPANYRGELPGDWPDSAKRKLLAEYKVAICLENMLEPFYFTEKFVEAVTAGCIPIYRADETVRDTILQGARWIDPADYSDSVDETIAGALNSDLREFQEQNQRWCEHSAVSQTHSTAIQRRILEILQR